MGRIGTVLSWAARTISGYVKYDPGGGAIMQGLLFSDSGVDAPPMAEDSQYSADTQAKGRTATLGFIDTKNASTAAPGERRTYARSAAGVPTVTQHLQRDGTASLTNDAGSITLGADGSSVLTNEAGTVTLGADGSTTIENDAGNITLLASGDIMATNGVSVFSLIAAIATLSDGTGSITLSGGALNILAPGGGMINGAIITPAGGITTALGTDVDTHPHTGGTLPNGQTGAPV
jgi:hypothetical protein